MNIDKHPSLVVITPVYEDAEVASILFKELAGIYENNVYVIAVDDGSINRPLDIDSLTAVDLKGVVIKLKRNVGHQRAIAIGLNYVADHLPQAEAVVVMDSDGEDIPKTIQKLLTHLSLPDTDVVVAQRKRRVETFQFRAFYFIYKLVFQLLTGRKISFGNFMALKPMAVKRIAAMQELWTHVAGCILTSKLRVSLCPLDRGSRYAGKSKMNFVGLALHGFRGLMVFTEDVLVRVGIACALLAGLSVIGGGTAIILKVIGYATPGWFSISLGILLLVFLQTGALALMTLMLTGLVRGGMTVTHIAYMDYVDLVQHTSKDNQ